MAEVGSVKYAVELDDSKLDQQADKTEKTITSKLGGAFGTAGKAIAAGSAAIAGGVAVAGKAMVSMAGDVSKTGDEIDKMSQKIGISAQAYQEWAYVFERSGADVNNLQTGMKTLSSVIADAAAGSEGAAAKLSAVGISIEEIGSLSQEDQLALVISRLQEMEGGAERTAAASDLLGRSATDMAAVLNMTAEDTQALIDETHEYGMLMSDDAVAASAAYQDSLTKMQHTMDGLKNGLATALLPGLIEVVDGITEVANGSVELGDAIDHGIESMLDTIDKKLPDVLSRGVQIITKIAEGIAKNTPKVIDAILKVTKSLLEKLVAALPDIQAKAVEMLSSLATGILQGMPTAITAIGNVIVGILQKLLENLPAMLQKGVELLTQLAAGIAQNAPAILSAIGDVIGRLLSTIASHLPQLLQKGIEMIGQLAAGLIRAVPQAIKGIGEVIKGIQNAFKQINWGELGRAIIDGIAAGLRNAGHVLMDAALNAARGAFDTVKSFFGISSPSKLMRDQIGVYIPAGIAEGIEDGSDDLDQSIEGMSTRMLRDITTDVNYNLPDMGDYAAQLGASINASASAQINVPLIVDGREIARATAWYTNQQLAWEAR